MPKSTSGTRGEPTELPPAGGVSAGSEESQPTEQPPAALLAGTEGSSESVPQLDPSAGGGVTAGGITAWQNDKRINALWSINQNRNVFVGVTGVGWKKLANNDDTAIVAFTMLSGSARITQTPVNYRDEADGMIHEMYVW